MILLLVLLALLTFWLYSFYSRVRSLPPGPFPLPIVGNLPLFAKEMQKEGGSIAVLKKWREKYGDVFTVWLGSTPTVNICDLELAKEAMISKGTNFSNRNYNFLANIARQGRGILFSNGKHWTEQRRFSLQALKNLGMGKNIMQDRVLDEFDRRKALLDKEINATDGELSCELNSFFELMVVNVINRIIFSEGFNEEEENDFRSRQQRIDGLMERLTIFDMALSEWNSGLWPFKKRKEKIGGVVGELIEFFKGQLEKRKKEIASGEHLLRDQGEDVVDAFLIEMEKKEHGESFTEESLLVTMLDLWAAGQETTTHSLQWAFLYLISHPEVVQKLQQELDEVTGRGRAVLLTDKQSSPYLNAVVLEVLRVSSIAPMNLPRETVEDTAVGGHLIKRGTPIAAQISVIMKDPRLFRNPDEFNPDRFLGSNAEEESLVVAFGMGKRACIGEQLARAELYLIIGNMVSSYNISADPDHPFSMKPLVEMGAARKPQKYRVVISKRHP